jgi:formate dehydrogenase iron-sulfur subunit
MQLAEQRVAQLKTQHVDAYVYGKEDIVGGLNSFYVLVDKPEVYGLPSKPELPSQTVGTGFALSGAAAAAIAITGLATFRKERMDEKAAAQSGGADS